MRDEFEIRYDADAQTAFDRLPDSLTALDLENGVDLQPSLGERYLKSPSRGRTALSKNERLSGKLFHPDRLSAKPWMSAVHEDDDPV